MPGKGRPVSSERHAALAAILKMTAKRPMTVSDVLAELDRQGLKAAAFPTQKIATNIISRWKKSGEVPDGRLLHSQASPMLDDLRDHLITDITDHYETSDQKISSRGVWYRLIAAGHLSKTEGDVNYYSPENLNGLINQLREDGRISFDVIEDPTRRIIYPFTFSDVQEVIRYAGRVYELDIWEGLPDRLIVLEEKRGLEGVFRLVTDELQVPLLATGGYNGRSMANKMCKLADKHDGQTTVLMFGDHDPDGEYAHRNVEEYTRHHFEKHFGGDGDKFDFIRVLLTQDQIADMELITRKTKTTSVQYEWWCKKFGRSEPSCEMDAIEPEELQRILREAIMKFIPAGHIEAVKERESEDIKKLDDIADTLDE